MLSMYVLSFGNLSYLTYPLRQTFFNNTFIVGGVGPPSVVLSNDE